MIRFAKSAIQFVNSPILTRILQMLRWMRNCWIQNSIAPLRHWLNAIDIHNATIAHCICRLIPAQCPFAREIRLLGYSVHLPPLCHLNPLYNDLMGLRFRALCYLADECQEDIQCYC